MDICKWLVDQKADVNAMDNFDRTPLEEAVVNQRDAVCAFLQNLSGSMDESHVVGMLCEAAFDGDVLKCAKLSNRVPSAPKAQDYDGRTALHVAVCEKNMTVAQLLLMKKADAQGAKDRWGQTPLDNANALNLTEWIPFLKDPSKCPTTITAAMGEQEQVQQKAAAKEKTQNSAYKEFMRLASEGDVAGVKNLTEKGGDPSEGDYDKRTPLHIAAAHNHAKVVEYLIKDKRVNINAVDRFRCTPLGDALKNKCAEVAEVLKRNGGTCMKSGYGNTLCAAAAKGDITKIEALADSGVDLTTGDYDGRTALHLAVCCGQIETVKFLLKRVELPALQVLDRMKNTPVDDARRFGENEILAVLLEAQERMAAAIRGAAAKKNWGGAMKGVKALKATNRWQR